MLRTGSTLTKGHVSPVCLLASDLHEGVIGEADGSGIGGQICAVYPVLVLLREGERATIASADRKRGGVWGLAPL